MSLPSVVAVVDGQSGLVVWHVAVSTSGLAIGRLCGARVLGDDPAAGQKLPLLVQGRTLLVTADGHTMLTSRGVKVTGTVDVEASVHAARAEVDSLRLVYRDELTRVPKRGLAEPDWPVFAEPAEYTPKTYGQREVDTALHIARWLASFADQRDSLESQRLSRRYLREHGGPSARQLPLALRPVAA